ncbi:ABC-three component system protein [Acinetobacter sp. A1-4-2]|uniref:ABC-three component system protein n=1 Tax=Acinetobacter sp. A1-4-2 TaxID=3156489 RepID=A0AAU7SZ55_9GAMM
MAEDIKSSLHDAVPSWNGFNYQGKIGLYVCLKNILDQLNENGSTSEKFNEFIESYSIEYEWIEDFSIKKNETYVSLHQVKHKDGSDFSSHLSAVVTILNRKLCRLSETDFIKYIELDYNYEDCESNEEKSKKKYEQIQAKMEEMKCAGYLDEKYSLAKDWDKVNVEIPNIERDALLKLLNDFEYFSMNTFSRAKVYFHTSEKVNKPHKELQKYKDMPIYHHASINGLKTLSSLNIFMGFDNQCEYSLELSDEETLEKIDVLIYEILKINFISENFTKDQIIIYRAILLKEIDNHVIQRHKNIREKLNTGDGYLQRREVIKFKNFFTPLKEIIRKEDQQYWESFCMRTFEEAYLDEIDKLEAYIRDDYSAEANQQKKIKLELFKSKFIGGKSLKYSELLIRLSPHIKGSNYFDVFYSQIANKESIRSTFLKLIQCIENNSYTFIVKTINDLKIHPSTISFSAVTEEDWDYCLKQYQRHIKENNHQSLFEATHLIAATGYGQNITNTPIVLDSLVESIVKEKNVKEKQSIINLSEVKFISEFDALKEINNG